MQKEFIILLKEEDVMTTFGKVSIGALVMAVFICGAITCVEKLKKSIKDLKACKISVSTKASEKKEDKGKDTENIVSSEEKNAETKPKNEKPDEEIKVNQENKKEHSEVSQNQKEEI